MTETEKIFLSALYALYLYESVCWIASGERVWVREREGWSLREVGPKSFTLLKRMPLYGDLLLTRPGRICARNSPDRKSEAKVLAGIARRLDRLRALAMLCRMQAIVLMIYVPALLATHKLARLWPVALSLVAALHVGIVLLAAVEVWGLSKKWSVIGMVVVNPMGGVRVIDAVAQALWDGNFRQGLG